MKKTLVPKDGTIFRAGKIFTLIELLVVIAIISILMAILLPALKKAKDLAKAIQCTGNLKQMAIGTFNYATDYGDYFPTYKTPAADGDWDWPCEIGPYLNMPSQRNLQWWDRRWYKTIFCCPAQSISPIPPDDNRWVNPILGVAYGVNYAMHFAIADGNWDASNGCLRKWKVPERKVMFGDCVGQNLHHQAAAASSRQMSLRHSRRSANLSFVDGHVTPAKFGTVPEWYQSGYEVWWLRDAVK